MTENTATIYEKAAARAFDKQAASFDLLYNDNTIIRYKRKRVRDHILVHLKPGSTILELNAGTGEDAVFFGKQGYKVHATDISHGMLDVLNKKINGNNLKTYVSSECCSFNSLENLEKQGPYDLVFSNFAGLNCTARLDDVLNSFTHLLKPGGIVTLVLLPKFCLWEFLLIFKGKFKTAFRRFSGRRGAKAKIDNEHFRCWYYNPSFIKKHLKEDFDVLGIEGLCSLVPPSYLESFPEKHPKFYSFLEKKEFRWKSEWPWRSVGDYYIISLRKKS